MSNPILLTDGYKLDHRRQYPNGTEIVYSNWTPRSNAYFTEASDGVVVFGVQYVIKRFLIEDFNNNFFNKPKEEVINKFARRIRTYLGEEAFNRIGTKHIEDLYDLGYLPIEIKALPEGTVCPIRVPALTIINTKPEFFWLTNYFETLLSNTLWLPMTSATTARLYKKELIRHATLTGYVDDPNIILGFSCHDFSMRGMEGIESTEISGLGHLTSFVGTESLPALDAAEEYYNANAESELLGSTVAATEHSVMCAGSNFDENGGNDFEQFKRIITEVYPDGFVSVVSDSFDYWRVVETFLPKLKDTIMSRNGRVIIRPDSGCPEDIICGYWTKPGYEVKIEKTPKRGKLNYYYRPISKKKRGIKNPWIQCSEGQYYGTYYMLYKIFGGSETKAGYKMLDNHIGLIYGDSITLERQKEIYARLEQKGFCASNLVLGVGSYSYTYKTRDSLGFAMKATWCQINGEAKEIFKKPKTDSGLKNSLKGLIRVEKDQDGKYYAIDQVSMEDAQGGFLETVFKDGKLVKEFTLSEIRDNVNASL